MNIEKCYKVRKHTKVTEVNFDVIRNDLLAFNYDSSTVLKTILVIEEIITNILKYSANQGDINTVISFSEDEILINIEDYGKYFDPTSEKDVNITEELSKRDTGGLGIHIVKNISTNISYHRVGGHNILQITINAEKNPIKATGLMKNTPRNEIKKIRNFTECTIFDIFNETLPFDIDSTLFNAALI